MDTATEGLQVKGPIRSINQWIDMSQQEVYLEDGTISKTCPAAMGYSFAAGTTDGPGEFDFTQGMLRCNLVLYLTAHHRDNCAINYGDWLRVLGRR